MPISTLQPEGKSKMKNVALYIIASIGVGLTVFFAGMLITNIRDLMGKSSLIVKNNNDTAEVLINGESVGNTPLELKDISSGETKITIKNARNQEDISINVTAKSEVIIQSDLGVSKTFSSHQSFWIEKNDSDTVLNVISNPSNSYVYIDGIEVGRTPYSSNSLTEDQYELKIQYPGHEDQTAIIKIQKGYTVNGSVKLFPSPVPSKLARFDGSDNLYNGIIENSFITADTQDWVNGTIYWNKTRGVNIAESGTTKDLVFDFFLDYKGNLYTNDGLLINTQQDFDKIKTAKRGLYLGGKADGDVLTDKAKEALTILGQVAVSGTKMALIKQTPTGWLRVRETPDLNGTEIARVNIGGKYAVLEEQTGWIKIKVNESLLGWVSADYVQITN